MVPSCAENSARPYVERVHEPRSNAKDRGDEDTYYEARDLAETLKLHLERYERVLAREGFEKPYVLDVSAIDVESEFEDYS